MKIHVLLGFHAHEQNYPQYSSQFLKVIKTLKFIDNVKETLEKIKGQKAQQKKDMLSYIEKILMEEEELERPLNTEKDFYFGLTILIFLICSLLAGWSFWKRKLFRRKKKRRERKRKARKRR